MLSDHLLILGCAVLFEMYLLCSRSPIPPTIAQPKPEKCHSHIPKQKKALQDKLLCRLQWYAQPLAFRILIQTLDLMRKHLSLSVKQQAISGTLPIVDSSRARKPVVL